MQGINTLNGIDQVSVLLPISSVSYLRIANEGALCGSVGHPAACVVAAVLTDAAGKAAGGPRPWATDTLWELRVEFLALGSNLAQAWLSGSLGN